MDSGHDCDTTDLVSTERSKRSTVAPKRNTVRVGDVASETDWRKLGTALNSDVDGGDRWGQRVSGIDRVGEHEVVESFVGGLERCVELGEF